MSIRYQEAETNTALDALIMADKVSLFWEMFDQLSEDCQKVMRLHFAEKSMLEIQTEMGYKSDNYARQSKFRCQKRLEQLIKNDARYKELSD